MLRYIKICVAAILVGIGIAVAFLVLHNVLHTNDGLYAWIFIIFGFLARGCEGVGLVFLNMIVCTSPRHCLRVILLGVPFTANIKTTSRTGFYSKEARKASDVVSIQN